MSMCQHTSDSQGFKGRVGRILFQCFLSGHDTDIQAGNPAVPWACLAQSDAEISVHLEISKGEALYLFTPHAPAHKTSLQTQKEGSAKIQCP